MEIIGLSGYARAGKDETAKILVEDFGFTRVAFADKLRDMLYALNPIVSYGWQTKAKDYPLEPVYVQNIIDRFGWDGYKGTLYGNEIRRLLQRLGTEAGRKTLWDSIWIDAAFAGLDKDDKIVVSDVRFPNEATAIEQRGGALWRIHRAGVNALNMHESEIALDNWDFEVHIMNHEDLEALRNNIHEYMEERS